MANFKETGVKISQFPDAPINTTTYRHKLELNHRIISWAPSHYGISTINKNYQISLGVLRNDMTGHIGMENSKGEYQEYLTFWKGNWNDTDRAKAYIATWKDTEFANKDYIKNKHGLDTKYDLDNRINRVFILDTAPWPLQAEDSEINPKIKNSYGKDPNPNNSKLVLKNYVDDRHNGFRKVEKAKDKTSENIAGGSILEIRPYTCFYQYSNPPAGDSNNDNVPTINICDTQIMEDGRTMEELLRHNRLVFYLRLTNNDIFHERNGNHKCNLNILVNGSTDNVKWSYEDELVEIVRENRKIKKQDGDVIEVATGYIFIRCEAEYEYDKNTKQYEFTVTCSNFFGRGRQSKKITRVEFPTNVTSEITDEKGCQITDKTILLDLSLHENQTFLTNIPLQHIDKGGTFGQYYINFDVSGLDDYHQYSWDYFVITPDQKLTVDIDGKFSHKDYDDVVFGEGGANILWANEDGYNMSPHLEPNKVYCFQFTKVFDNVLIGRIKYYINLIKKK